MQNPKAFIVIKIEKTMNNRLVILLLGALVILSSIAIAYKEEIKDFSQTAIEDYILKQIQTLPESNQEEFKVFKELSIEDKLLRSWELNGVAKE